MKFDNNKPVALVKLDSIFYNFYENEYRNLHDNSARKQYLNYMDNSTLLKYAKYFVQLHYLPDITEHNYWSKVNEPFNEQYRREKMARKMGMTFNEVPMIMPGALRSHIVKKIYEKLNWNWKFHLENRYFVIVKVVDFKRGTPSRPGTNRPYYTCRLLNDIKGNFHETTDFLVIGNFVEGEMEVNKDYLILLWGKNIIGTEIVNKTYLLRGLSTDHIAFFEFKNNVIIDPDQKLRFNKTHIELNEFKDSIHHFLFDNAEITHD